MSVQQLERPPSYLKEDESVNKTAIGGRMSPSQAEQAPSLNSLAAMATTTLAQQQRLSSSHDVKSPLVESQPFQTSTGTFVQPLTFPHVPLKDPGPRADSTGSGNAMNIDSERRDQSVSMEDPDDRMAAEALCGLGKVGQ